MKRSAFRLIPDILRRVNESQSTVDPLKLQKLLYYVQAWSLVLREKPLFSEPLEAWIHGPVVPSVYQRYKTHSYQTIPLSTDQYDIEEDEAQVVDLVCENYGRKTGTFLEDLTHSEVPWLQARSGLKSHQRSSRQISLNLMMRYHSKFLQSQQPPRIKAEALQIHKKAASSRLFSFMAGMGSSLDLMPYPRRGRTSFMSEDFADPISDLEALQSDWSVVGSCMEKALNSMDIHE